MLVFNQTDRKGLAWNVGLALLAVLVTNGLIAVVNPRETSNYHDSALTPPGFVIGIVWTALFVCMGLARWYLLKRRLETGNDSAAPVLWLGLLCMAYPVYTSGLRNETIGLIGNLVTLLATLGVIAYSFRRSRAAAFATIPIALWLSYASFLTALAVRHR